MNRVSDEITEALIGLGQKMLEEYRKKGLLVEAHNGLLPNNITNAIYLIDQCLRSMPVSVIPEELLVARALLKEASENLHRLYKAYKRVLQRSSDTSPTHLDAFLLKKIEEINRELEEGVKDAGSMTQEQPKKEGKKREKKVMDQHKTERDNLTPLEKEVINLMDEIKKEKTKA